MVYNGNHDPIISAVFFEKAREIRQDRVEDLNGRRFHNGDERLLAGTIKCARCKSHMVGVSTYKQERRYP